MKTSRACCSRSVQAALVQVDRALADIVAEAPPQIVLLGDDDQ